MRVRVRKATLLALAFGVAVAGPATAQRRRGLVDVSPDHFRRGLWLDLGVGAGEESFKFGDGPYTEGLTKPTFLLRLGGTPSRHLRLGGEGTVWVNSFQDDSGDNITESLWSLMAIARFFPAPSTGFFLKGGAGLGVTAADVDFGVGTSETGFATSLGVGYEIQVSRQLFLTPSFDWYQHKFDKRGEDTLHERLFNFNLALTIQPGR